jgi:tetratricopeptide (TPR) repeat protein
MFLVVGATFAFLVLASDNGVPAKYLWGGLAGTSLLVTHSLVVSEDPYRSIEFLTLAWAYYCLFGYFRFSTVDLGRRLALTLVLSATAVSAYGLYQNFFGLEQMYNLVFYSGADDAVRVPILDRVASERIFSTFALPGTLWGFLILAIPLHRLFWTPDRILVNLALAANILLIVGVTVLTRSYGLVVGLFALGIGWLFTRPQGVSMKRLTLIALPLVPIAAGIYSSRAATHNPVSLRLQNWLSAWEMFVSHPLGSGLNSYATLYMQHQQLGANETQFAHNTPIQLLAELGGGAMVAGVLGVYWIAKRYRTIEHLSFQRRWLLLAVVVWLAHNMIDINVYFASIGAVGIALVAALAWRPPSGIARPASRRLIQATTLVAVPFLAASAVIYVSGELYHRAQVELAELEMETAVDTLKLATLINPFDSSILHEAGQSSLELYHKDHQLYRIEDSLSFFQKAVNMSPQKIGPRVGLSLAMSTMNRTDEALEQLAMAQALAPGNRQASAIRRLIENRQAGAEPGP